MTAPLTHTAPVPLPAMQEPGPAFVREAAAPAAQQAPADTSASAHGRGTDRFCGLSVRRNRGEYPRYGPRDDTRPVRHGRFSPEHHTPNRTAGRHSPGARRGLAGGGYAVFRAAGGRLAAVLFAGRPAAGHGRHALARRAGRSGIRSGIDPRSGPRPAGSPRLRPSPKTPSFRASSCCSPQPTPSCSTAIWATYGCC